MRASRGVNDPCAASTGWRRACVSRVVHTTACVLIVKWRGTCSDRGAVAGAAPTARADPWSADAHAAAAPRSCMHGPSGLYNVQNGAVLGAVNAPRALGPRTLRGSGIDPAWPGPAPPGRPGLGPPRRAARVTALT